MSWLQVNKKENRPCAIIAHRGYNAIYPENTLLAFEKAIDIGADYIELDIDFSADGEIVVIHDDTTGRVANKDLHVIKTELKTLQSLDLGEKQHIPTLKEVFDLCKGKIDINIEIKGSRMAETLNNLILDYKWQKNVIISSFNHGELIDLQSLNPELKIATLEPTGSVPLGIIANMFNKSKYLQRAKGIGAHAIHPFVLFASKRFIQKAHDMGIAVNVWTSDNPKQWKKLIANGIDGICTNDPGKLKAFIESLQFQ